MFSSELSILMIYGLIVAITLLLQVVGFTGQLGMGYILSSRDEHRTAEGIAARLERALSNSVTGMALIAPPILALAVEDRYSGTSLLACQVFLMARIVYLPAYMFRITGVRTAAWMIGFLATITLYFLAL